MSKNAKRYVKHHIKNRSEHGLPIKENLLFIDETKEKLLHIIFKNLDFYGIIMLIIRTAKMKHYERVNPNIKRFYKYLD